MIERSSDFASLECGNQSHEDHPCDPVPNGDGTATCSACGWTGGFPDPAVPLADRVLSTAEATEAAAVYYLPPPGGSRLVQAEDLS